MPRVTARGQITIPEEVRDDLGIRPGDRIDFEAADSCGRIHKIEPGTVDGEDPFEKYRGSVDSNARLPDRMRRLRGEYPHEKR